MFVSIRGTQKKKKKKKSRKINAKQKYELETKNEYKI